MVFLRMRVLAVLMLVLLLPAAVASAQTSVTVAWNANSEPEVTGYTVSWGPRSGFYNASADAGNQTQFTANGLDPDQRYYFVVQAYTGDGLRSAPSAEVSNNGLIVQTGGTLVDQRPSIFWHNQVTGRLMTWHLNGTTVVDTRAVSIPGISDTNWKVAGVGDLNGDRHPDLVWRHATQGLLAVWFLQNNAVIGTSYLSIDRVADFNWRLGGIGDVDGDGYADLVWQHTGGSLAVWLMRGATVLRPQVLTYDLGPNSPWQIAAIGDVNRDGYADIIWQTTDAWLAVWLLRGSTVISGQYLSTPQMLDPTWRIRAVASPDVTGNPALVWRNTVDGSVALWYMNTATVLGSAWINPRTVDNANWAIVGSR